MYRTIAQAGGAPVDTNQPRTRERSAAPREVVTLGSRSTSVIISTPRIGYGMVR
jgi:hypothetical protein